MRRLGWNRCAQREGASATRSTHPARSSWIDCEDSTGYCGCQGEGRWHLANYTGAFFEEEEWIDWYCPGTDGWVHPGDAAADPDNYGSTESLWAYEIELRDGRVFWVGARADGKSVGDE